jgi:hypothetical protein
MVRGEEMKKYLRLVAPVLFILALNAAALAQDFTPKVRAQIPFNFYAGNKMLPAGSYTFAVSSESHNFAIFQNASGVGTFLLSSPLDGSKGGAVLLTFRANDEGIYTLQKLETPEFGAGFTSAKALSHSAQNQSGSNTQVLVADLVR